MKYREYSLRKTKLKNPEYRYVAKKGKNALYASTQESIRRLIRRVESNIKRSLISGELSENGNYKTVR